MIANILIQFLFVRLSKFEIDGKTKYCLTGFTLPLTGWWSDYIHLGKLKFWYL